MPTNPNPVKSFITACSLALLLVAGGAALAAELPAGKTAPAPGIAAKVLELTGAETRIVWLRNKQWETSKGGVDGGADFSIMAFDTGGKGERELVPAVPEGEIYNPLITSDGRRVIYTTGDGGISLSGGDRKTLTPARLLAENNHIYNFSRWCRTYRPAIGVGGCGNIVRSNLLHHGPHSAIQLGGNDHLVEYNEIHSVCSDTGDVGAFYMGRDWTARGTVIRHNYWHHIQGPGRLGAMGIYLDDQASGISVIGNIFYRVTRAVFIGGGCDNVVENNIFVDCTPAVHIDARGLGWQKKATDDPKGELRSRLAAMPYQDELWSKRYPELVKILDDNPGTPKRNRVLRNISVGGKWDDVDAGTRPHQIVAANFVDRDPHFIDRAGADFRLRASSPAPKEIEFRPIPTVRIGLYRDRYRATWPVEHRPRELPPETEAAPSP